MIRRAGLARKKVAGIFGIIRIRRRFGVRVRVRARAK
jgi:hypothetical protein